MVVSLAAGGERFKRAGQRPRQFTRQKYCGMTDKLDGVAAILANDVKTCGICLEDSKDPLDLPCGHSFCPGCLDGWRSRYGVEEEMRTKCPTCRATIPPSKEMVTTLRACRAQKQKLEDCNLTSSEHYHRTCEILQEAEEKVGADWDGVTVLQSNDDKTSVAMPNYVARAIQMGDIKSALKWIIANRSEGRANATSSAETLAIPALIIASIGGHLALMSLLLQLRANVDTRDSSGSTAISCMFTSEMLASVNARERIVLLLSWGASFFPGRSSRKVCASVAWRRGEHELVNLLESELGGRRCEIVNISSRPELNGETCVADEFLPDSNQYKVTLEKKGKEVLVIGADNLKRRDRTPQDCGYYIEFKNGRTIRHDFDSSEDCQAFVAALNRGEESQPVVTEEAEARAEPSAAELLAEIGPDDSPNESSSGCRAKKPKKKKRVKKKK